MNAERDQLLKDGFLIRRGMIEAEALEALRQAVETRVDEAKSRANRERKPHEPEGGFWETIGQPRVSWTPDLVGVGTDQTGLDARLHFIVHLLVLIEVS